MWSEQVAGMGRERQKNFLEYCQRMIRENFIFNLHQRNLTYMSINEQNFIYLLLLQQYNHLQREVEEYHFSIYILFYM